MLQGCFERILRKGCLYDNGERPCGFWPIGGKTKAGDIAAQTWHELEKRISAVNSLRGRMQARDK